MSVSDLAGKPAPRELLVNVPRLVSAYYTHQPDVDIPAQRVAFGTSGHRGSATKNSFNENHILAICQAICEHRQAQGINGPLFLGMDTHALSEAAFATAVEVFAANGVDIMIQAGLKYTPTPVISHAILTYNHGKSSGLADGVVVTPSHNPPDDGGFKYNPPSAGPADTKTTNSIQERANHILAGQLQAVQRVPFVKALRAATTHRLDYVTPYVSDLGNIIDMEAIAAAGLKIGVDPLGGASVAFWEPIAERYHLNIDV
ncbi:MAG TPA: phosphoglucomutase, partial [Anaerolineae bacterium]